VIWSFEASGFGKAVLQTAVTRKLLSNSVDDQPAHNSAKDSFTPNNLDKTEGLNRHDVAIKP
jgi:hypothetical protein